MNEARHLVAGVERAARAASRGRRRCGRRATEHGADEPLRIAALAQHRRAVLGMLVERRVALVVEVVQQRDVAPRLLVLAELAGVGAHRRLDRQRVAEQRLALRPLGEQLPRRRHGRGRGRRSWRADDTPPTTAAGPGRRPNGATLDGDGDRDPRGHGGSFPDRGRTAALGHRSPGRQQERRAADPGSLPADRRPGHARERAPHPRRRGDDRADGSRSASRSSGRPATRCGCGRPMSPAPGSTPSCASAHPRVDPAGRPAAGPLRRRRRAAARAAT